MDLLHSLILGLVEGITEFLPISSTGHLILAQNALGIPTSSGLNAYLIVIQIGAILAVVSLYPARFLQLFRGVWEMVCGHWASPAARLVQRLFIAFLPAAAMGLWLGAFIEAYLFTPLVVVFALVGGAVAMFIAEKISLVLGSHKSIEQLSLRDALTIGVLQIFSLIPGTSRSMTTIVGGYFARLTPAASAEFSFLLGAITLSAASSYKLVKNHHELASLGALPIAVGLIAAFVSALIVVRFFVGLLTRFGLIPWAYYRLALALLVLL